MSGYKSVRYLVILIILVNCLLPNTLGNRRHPNWQHRRRVNRGSSPNRSEKISVGVNRTIKNAMPGKTSDPKLRPVNVDLEQESDLNRNLSPPESGTSDEKLLDTGVFKTLLRDLLERLDTYGSQRQTFRAPPFETLSAGSPPAAAYDNSVDNPLHKLHHNPGEGPRHIYAHDTKHCVLHGLWLSAVAGAAIELVPEQKQGHIEIHTRIFELPDNPFPSLINSQWTGKGIISQESPTTITVVFQEHIETAKENHAKERGLEKEEEDEAEIIIQLPRTAVFVGQCLVCQGNPTLQGAWVVFPASQTCTAAAGFATGNQEAEKDTLWSQQQKSADSIRMTSPDAIYLLKYY